VSLNLAEIFRFSFQALNSNKFRTFLTALGLVIGNASVILVVTISLTSRDYILEQIQRTGSNLIFAQYEAGSNAATIVEADFINLGDVQAVRDQLGERVIAVTGVMASYDKVRLNGRDEDLSIIGTDEYYPSVRNLALLSGRFLDRSDLDLRNRVALVTEKLAKRMSGSASAAVGQTIKLQGLQFTIIGTFKERVESFGLSELSSETVLIPMSVLRYFRPVERIDPLYVQARTPGDVEPVTQIVRTIVEARHRSGARYKVENLTAILDAAKQIAMVLSLVLVLISAIALIISGIGIMNIMLVTVTERTREIGLRLSLGATRKAILAQFLVEAVLISIGGGMIGILIGAGVPLVAGYFSPDVQIPISWISIAVAFGVSVIVGLTFGLMPANRAAQLSPTEALRYE
jgi:putative ABC transport system permease protein